MDMVYANLIPALWLIWLVYWFVAGRDVKTTQRHESFASRASHIVPLIIGTWLLWTTRLPRGFLGGKLLRRNLFQEVEFVALTHFDSLESVRAAAGEEYGYVIIPETGRKLLSRFDQRVAIYEVVVINEVSG